MQQGTQQNVDLQKLAEDTAELTVRRFADDYIDPIKKDVARLQADVAVLKARMIRPEDDDDADEANNLKQRIIGAGAIVTFLAAIGAAVVQLWRAFK